MPRFENLKGSMNPFSNNRPRLTASERIRNKRDATIYQAEKSKYQASRKCYNGGKNIKYYKNGTVRSTINHEMNQKLARGAVLCEDCNHQGLVCASTLTKKNFAKVNLGNSSISTFNLETGLNFLGYQINTSRVIVSDISGSWNDPSGRVECQPTPPSACYFPYGYADNLITVPRNLGGSGIIIDPDNLLFNQDDNCNTFKIPKPKYLKYMEINSYLVYEGILADASGLIMNGVYSFEGPTNRNIYTLSNYKDLLNTYVIITFQPNSDMVDPGGPASEQGPRWPITGVIEKICVTNKKITVANAGWNLNILSTGGGGYKAQVADPAQYSGAPQYFEADVFKVFIGLQYMNPDALLWQGSINRSKCIDPSGIPSISPDPAPNALVFPPTGSIPQCAEAQFKPSFPNAGFVIKKMPVTNEPTGAANSKSILVNSSWAGDAVLASSPVPPPAGPDVESWYAFYSGWPGVSGLYGSRGYNASPMTVGLGQFKLTDRCSEPQVRQNKTRQSYLSCIEQGTKNIKFTKNTL